MLSTFKLVGRINTNFQGQVDIVITLPEGIPKDIGSLDIIIEDTKTFGHKNLSAAVINLTQSAFLFLFSLAIFYHSRVISEEL